MRRKTWITLAAATGLAALGAGIRAGVAQRGPHRQPGEPVGSADLRNTPGLKPSDNLLFNGWGITPAGEHVSVPSDLPLKIALSPDGHFAAAVHGGYNNTGVTLLDVRNHQAVQFLPLLRAWAGLAFTGDGKHLLVAGGNSGLIHSFAYEEGKLTAERQVMPDPEPTGTFLAGIAIHPRTGAIYVCNEGNHEVWELDPQTLKRRATVVVGQHPHSCLFGADRQHLYVSDWGSRTVSVIDTKTNRRVRELEVGLRPTEMALAPDGRLFVACSGDNTVHVLQTRTLETPELPADPTRRPPEGVREVLSTSIYPSSPEGSTPDAVAVAPDGKTLYIANADNNDVMVVDISDSSVSRVQGFIPTGWYPTALSVLPGDGTLLVANGKGLHSGPNGHPAEDRKAKPTFTYIARELQGTFSFIRRPDESQLASYTKQVRSNSPYTPETIQAAATRSDSAIPDKTGAPCPIKYVLYIVKENRTYDQLFGDFKDAKGRPAGNGDPRLVMYGEKVTANHHKLAQDFVLLDNLYCNGEVSVDGHSWCDAAIATDHNERGWMMSYSQHGKLPGNREMDEPLAGYLWDNCRRHGVSFRCYGEGAARVPATNRGTWPGGRDMNRVEGWIQDLHRAEQSGDLPRFQIMSLGEDHTQGTKPGAPTPNAAVASNDIALGKIVEAASKSKFWKEMAIFVIEDDAQNGPDHVDAHRTAGLVVSPYARRGVVDSTMYTTASMVRTMELILGLPPLTQYDAGATPMFHCFQKRAEPLVYAPVKPEVDVTATNSRNAPGAKQSLRMDFDEYDRAPEDELNRILWRVAKGPSVPYPAPIHRAVFTHK